jgi:hypothetical protein
MSNPENTYKNARVSGHVSYLNEMNQRVGVPHGPCEISDNNGYGPNFLRWKVGEKAASVGKGLCYRVDIDNICRHCWT